MMTKPRNTLAVAAVLISLATGARSAPPEPTPVEQTQAWQARRNASLGDSDGWLALAGLFPLSPGELTLGSGEDRDIRLPEKAPTAVGHLLVAADTLRYVSTEGTMALHTDAHAEGPTRMHTGSLSWWVIERVGQQWLRVSDAENPALTDPTPLEYFPIHQDWRVQARLRADTSATQLSVPTVLGVPILEKVAGIVEFEMHGNRYQLQALDGGDDELFLIFADATSGKTTYGAGRFLWAEAPDESGMTTIDFNRAYNPPCAFSPYATCPLPPPGNELDLAVTAGEKSWHGASH